MIALATIIGTIILAFVLIQFVSWLFSDHPKPKKRELSALDKLAIQIELDGHEFRKALKEIDAWEYWPSRSEWLISNNERGSVIDSREI